MDNPLAGIIPAKWRRLVYFVATLALAGYGVYQASDADWGQVVGAVLAALVTGLATANTHPAQDDTSPE